MLITNYTKIKKNPYLKDINYIIQIKLKNDTISKKIKINNNRRIYIIEKLDFAFIEILPKIDKLYDFLEIDENIYQESNYKILKQQYINKSIYLIQYYVFSEKKFNNKLEIIYSMVNKINDKNLEYNSKTKISFQCSPILSLDSLKVIGINRKNIIYNKPEGRMINFKNENIINYFNSINIIYEIKKKENSIKIFGDNFVKTNRNKLKILLSNEKEIDICENINLKENGISISLSNCIEITLIGIMNITDMSFMFYECESLLSLPDISKWDTININDMSFLFCGCSNLKSISDISKWNTKNVTDMNHMFFGCSELKSLPDISKWDISNVSDFYGMFSFCNENLNIPLKFKKNYKCLLV